MKAILTWKRGPEEEIVVEPVELIDSDKDLSYFVEGHPVTVTADEMARTGMVYFAEPDGTVFFLNPNIIISVDVIGRNIYSAYNENRLLKESVMDTIKKAASRTKKFVSDHRVGIAIVGTTVVMLKINAVARQEMTDFITEKGLMDEYLTPTDEEMGA